MRTFRCSCSKTKVVEDNIIMVVCEGCQREMIELNKEGDKWNKKI